MSQTPFNPFEHHHAHHHDDADEAALDLLDPAQQSLNDALRVSFGILKIAMLGVFIAYLLSGFAIVGEQEQAVRLRFGKIVGDGDSMILQRGWHPGLPFPIQEVVKIDTREQTLRLNTQFMYDMPPEEALLTLEQRTERRQAQPLDPAKDGSLITADVNIVHGDWTLTYVIEDPVRYIAQVGDPRNMEKAAEFVRVAAEQAIVHAMAHSTSDDLLSGQTANDVIARYAQDALNNMQTGLRINSVTGTVAVPLQVRQARARVSSALSERAQAEQAARRESDEMLGSTAGQAWPQLWAMVQAYERARLSGDERQLQAAEAQLNSAFATFNTGSDYSNLPIGGEVAMIVNQALAYRTQVEERTRSEADYFTSMFERYNENPQVFVQRAWTEMLEKVLDPENDIETFYYQDMGQLRVTMHRDPDIQRRREEKKLLEDQERYRQQIQQQQPRR